MKSNFILVLTSAVAMCLLIAPACRQQPQTRQYEEKGTVAVPASGQTRGRSSAEAWSWEKPLQWIEKEKEGLRLATFFITSREGPGECTLITLPGNGGGAKANVQRWLEQLRLPLFSQSDLENFLARQKIIRTRSGLAVTVIDFMTLGHVQNRLEKSLLVAIIPGENQTLFVKMSAGRDTLRKNREIFYEFCQSLSQGA